MKEMKEKTRRYPRRAIRVHDVREPWGTAFARGIIPDNRAAAQVRMGKQQFRNFARSHRLSRWRDGEGEIYRSIAELDALAKKLGLFVQIELPWEDSI